MFGSLDGTAGLVNAFAVDELPHHGANRAFRGAFAGCRIPPAVEVSLTYP
jgi:hypothetical protein